MKDASISIIAQRESYNEISPATVEIFCMKKGMYCILIMMQYLYKQFQAFHASFKKGQFFHVREQLLYPKYEKTRKNFYITIMISITILPFFMILVKQFHFSNIEPRLDQPTKIAIVPNFAVED